MAAEGAFQHVEFGTQKLHLDTNVVTQCFPCDQREVSHLGAIHRITYDKDLNPVFNGIYRHWNL
jgi:hypothetical protein